MNLIKFAGILNDKFGSPFLPPGFVKAEITPHGTLWLNIGHRDAEFDKDLNCVGSGTDMLPQDRWVIRKGEKGVKKSLKERAGPVED
jgi:hypothetical protein